MRAIFAIMALFLLGGCFDSHERHHIALNNSDGITTTYFPRTKELQTSKKQPLILFFFTKECKACRVELKSLNELALKFGKEAEFVGIINSKIGSIEELEEEEGEKIEFMVIADYSSVDYFSKAVGGVFGVPTLFIFDSNGKFYKKFLGLTPKEILEKELKFLI